MTLILGIRCTDGVVIGSDSAITFGASPQEPTIEQTNLEKIEIIDDRVIVATTGYTGHAQRLVHGIDKLWKDKAFRGDIQDIACLVAKTAVQDFHSTGAFAPPYGFAPQMRFGALIALPRLKTAELIEFEGVTFQPDVKNEKTWFASMGSGQSVADPLLGFVREVFWGNSPPTKEEGIFAATMVLTLGCKLSPFGVDGPVRIAVLESQKKNELCARFLNDKELLEHQQNVEGAFEHLRDYQAQLQRDPQSPELPSPPKSR